MVQNPHTSATRFETVRHNHINSWNFYKFCDTLKNGQTRDFHLGFFKIVSAGQDFTVVTKLIKNLKSLYGFGGRCLKIRELEFRVYYFLHYLQIIITT